MSPNAVRPKTVRPNDVRPNANWPKAIWLVGATCSGKTSRLIEHILAWETLARSQPRSPLQPPILVFAATGDNRIELADRIAEATHGRCQFDSTTPLGFFQQEVELFYPLLAQQLNLKAQFPLRLRPETEQELATRLWRAELDAGTLQLEGVSEYFMVRRSLDLMQLCASSGTPLEELAAILKVGYAEQAGSPEIWDCIAEVLQRWRNWCLDHGIVTYGLITELYWRYLFPNATYQQHLKQRYRAIVADDVDNYPAVTQPLFEFFLDQGKAAAFSFNPDGGLRSGLGADPDALAELASRCQVEPLTQSAEASLGVVWGSAIVQWVNEPLSRPQLPDTIQAIQTASRAQLLRQTAEVISEGIQSGQVRPEEVAVIGPGLDAIARYTLREIMTSKGIPVESLNDQRPLVSSPMVRALLTLLALVYPGLGRLVGRDAIAEMLVILSQTPAMGTEHSGLELARIDPVRAGLLVDYCFVPDPEHPHLLPATAFPRWDRLGYQATQVYDLILQWLEAQKQQQQQRLIPSPVVLLDRAIQKFIHGGSHLPYDQLAVLRELMETAQHYWEVDTRLRKQDLAGSSITPSSSVRRFIQLLQDGTITADPYPVRPAGQANRAVTLATIYQYRANRLSHRWQFWLDVGSAFWLTGGSPLFGAPLFLRQWSGRLWTTADTVAADQQRLQRQLLDLLYRAQEKVYLCHSDLATSGQDQTGPLLTLVNAATPVLEVFEQSVLTSAL